MCSYMYTLPCMNVNITNIENKRKTRNSINNQSNYKIILLHCTDDDNYIIAYARSVVSDAG